MIITMDITVIDAPDMWGMLLSRKFVADLGCYIQMDISYATIPAAIGGMVDYTEKWREGIMWKFQRD